MIVPHLVNAFTESLDPIKAYECLAIDRPTVATPVAGFRELATVLTVADRNIFSATVATALATPPRQCRPSSLPSWNDRASEFEKVLLKAAAAARVSSRLRA